MDNFRRLLAMPQVMGYASILCNESIIKYSTDAQTMYRCQMEALNYYKYDAVYPACDHLVQAQSLGSKLEFNESVGYPYLSKNALENVHEWERLKTLDGPLAGRVPVILEACYQLRKNLDQEVLVIPKIVGPFTLAGQLIELREIFECILLKDLNKLQQFLEYLTDCIIAYGDALIKSGADVIVIYDPLVTPDIVPADIFYLLEFENLKKICTVLRSKGCKGIWIQFPTREKYFPVFNNLQPDFLSVDEVTKIEDNLSDSSTLLVGNIPPFSFVEGSSATIEKLSFDFLESSKNKSKIILGGSCEIPLESKSENILALVNFAKSYKMVKSDE